MLSEQVWWWGKLQLVRISPLCRHVKEAWGCGAGSDSLGQLGDPVGQIQAAGIYMKAYLGLHFICNCLLDCRNCLLTSQILGLYYKLKRSNKASAVYWLRGTLLYPWVHCNARIIIIVQSILSAVEAEGELLGKLFGQGAPAYRSHSGFTGLLASPTVASLVTGPTVASLHWGSYTNTNTNTDCWANCLGKVCQYRSHSGFTCLQVPQWLHWGS